MRAGDVKVPPALQPFARTPTFGMMVDWLEDEELRVGGVVEAARAHGVNLVCFVGASLHAPLRFGEQRNVVYELAGGKGIDALMIVATVGNHRGLDDQARYCERFRPLPMASLAAEVKWMTSFLIDGAPALREAIRHLVEDHQYRRIAFVGGPEGNIEARDRLRIYREELTRLGLPPPDSFVVIGDFKYASGVDAVRILLDERGESLDAIVAANDRMAFGAIDALRARDIRVPRDVAVIGFDDIPEARNSTPPLTTIRQPLRQQGGTAVETLLRRLRGEHVDDVIVQPTELVIRRSCGCNPDARRVAIAGSLPPAPTDLRPEITVDDALQLRRSRMLEVMREPVSSLLEGIPEGWEEDLLDALIAELRGAPHTFTERVNRLLEDVAHAGGSGSAWQPALSALRRELMPCLTADPHMRSHAEDLLQQARVMVGDAVEHTQAQHRLIVERRARALSESAETLSAAFDLKSLGDALRECLPRLGIPSAYLVLNNEDSPGTRVAFAHDPGRDPETLEGLHDDTNDGAFAPDGLLPVDRTYAMVVQPLFFKDETFGHAIFEMGPLDGLTYEALREQVSGALKVARLIEELQVRAGQLRQSQKMETLGQLSGGIAHDFNNLLQAIHGYAELARVAEPGSPDRATDLEEIVRAADRAAELTRQLLTFSQPTRANARVVDVNGCVDRATPMIKHLLGPTIQLSTVLRPEAGSIFIDPTQLEQVLVNLCVNGRDAMPGGGSLTIETGRRLDGAGTRAGASTQSSDLSTPETSAPGALTFVAVSDTGVGIVAEIRDRIFEPFFTTKDTGRGTGLGLSIVYGIVRSASGDIVVESEPGCGTRFSLTFPASEDPEEGPAIAVESPVHGTETVLLVEDEQAIRSLAERVLTNRGYRVLSAANAIEARELWSANEGKVDLLLSDVTMPGLSGVAFAAELACSVRPPRTLFISGHFAGEGGGAALPSEARFLPKPFSMAALLDAVRATLDSPTVAGNSGTGA
jgi:signal transduction histidine kinase/DNA-binding LacI/PurR family transcriptional regulator/ActR/RegA family two-component response regulator